MNILVTGAGGQLGNEMQIIAKSCNRDTYFFTDVCNGYENLDITDLDAVRSFTAAHRINAIVNCAAFTNVDAAETAGPVVETLNATAPGNLATAMREAGGLLLHISTDYVFGKEPYNIPCREDQKGTPTGEYGRSKLHGEQLITASGADYVIIRTAWLYSEFGKNFCKTMLSLTASKPELKVVFDQCGTPTYALDLARAIAVILDDYAACAAESSLPYPRSGIYHFSNEGVCSWYDFTKMIQSFDNAMRAACSEAPTTCNVLPCHSNEFPSPVIRPAYSVLDKTKIKTTFGIEIPYWTDSLRRCIENIRNSRT